jgi:SH3 domain protein
LVTLPQLQQRLAEGDSGLQRLTNENQALKKENRDLARQIAELQRDGSRLQNELGEIRELSSNVIQVDEQNRQLSQRLAETEQLLQEMRADNQKLASRSNREWFIVGAAVLFIGMAMGLILPRIRWKKKSSWSDF